MFYFYVKFIFNFVKYSVIKKSPSLGLLVACVDNNDSGHDFEHGMKVFKKSKHYCNRFNPTLQNYIKKGSDNDTILYFSSLFHDSYDHKFPHSEVKKNILFVYLDVFYGRKISTSVINIIENISFSKETKGFSEKLSTSEIMIRNIVSDADKFYALGQEGYDRCYAYSKETLHLRDEESRIQHVIQHCFEKLFLLPQYYMKTTKGKEEGYKQVKILAQIISEKTQDIDLNEKIREIILELAKSPEKFYLRYTKTRILNLVHYVKSDSINLPAEFE